MSFDEFLKDRLWPILVETVHSIVMFPNHKAYTRENIIAQTPEITAAELAVKLSISKGEAMVILHELKQERESKQ